MTTRFDPPKAQFAFLTLLAIATGVVNALQTTALRGLGAGAVVFGLAALLYWGRERFDVIDVMSGSGDERTRALYTRATAFMGTALASVITAWWLIEGISGDVDETLTVLTAVGAASFVAGAALAAERN